MDDILADDAHMSDFHAQRKGGVKGDEQCQAAVKNNCAHVLFGDADVHNPLEKDGNQHGERGGGEHQRHHQKHLFFIRRYVSGKAF